HRCVVPSVHVIESRFVISLLSSKLLTYTIGSTVALRRGPSTRSGCEFLTERQIIMSRLVHQAAAGVENHSRRTELIYDHPMYAASDTAAASRAAQSLDVLSELTAGLKSSDHQSESGVRPSILRFFILRRGIPRPP